MNYVNQLDYPTLLYPTSLDKSGNVPEPCPTFAKAGCGLASVCMLVSKLIGVELTPEQAVALSVGCGANVNGTNMSVLGKAISEQYDLRFSVSDDLSDLLHCLQEGGAAIFNSGAVNRIFSDNGHFLLADRLCADGTVAVLDPSLTPEKYTVEFRKSKVRRVEEVLFVTPATIAEECSNRSPAYYLFSNK